MELFIRNTPEDMLDEISRHYIKGMDWTGTKWEKPYLDYCKKWNLPVHPLWDYYGYHGKRE